MAATGAPAQAPSQVRACPPHSAGAQQLADVLRPAPPRQVAGGLTSCPFRPHPAAAAAAAAATEHYRGGDVWPPGQPSGLKDGRLVMNTEVTGACLNSAAGKRELTRLLAQLRANLAATFPPSTFGRLHLEGGSGLRLVSGRAYPCACTKAPPPRPRLPSPPPLPGGSLQGQRTGGHACATMQPAQR